MQEDIRESVQYWADQGVETDVFYHNSNKRDLDEFTFEYRKCNSDAKGYYGEGIFTHAGTDEYFNRFGRTRYAVIARRGFSKTMEEEDGNKHYETFIRKSSVLEILH